MFKEKLMGLLVADVGINRDVCERAGAINTYVYGCFSQKEMHRR